MEAPAESELNMMVSALHHRGPDEQGVYSTVGAGLANARLSIIDLPGGTQPIWNEEHTVCVVFNGEIYNHEELRSELTRCGHEFSTRSDTEVIVHLYEEYGEQFARQLNGMFAIALWDERIKKGLLVRDRIGIKPLYYARYKGRILFASEIKGILAYPGFPRELSAQGLDSYLSLRYVPDDQSIFDGVSKLRPGQLAVCGADGTFDLVSYWELSAEVPAKKEQDEGKAEEELFEIIKDAVKIRLMSDVPFGAFLSGGLDSSGIVGLMSQLLEDRVKTFSIGFSEMPGLDERSHSREVAEACHTEHWEVDCTADRIEKLPLLLSHFDEPFADPIIVPTHQLAELAREHVKVVLSGEGADELFGGYARFRREKILSNLASMPRAVRTPLAAILARLPDITALNELRRVGSLLKSSQAERFASWVTAFDDTEKGRLYRSADGRVGTSPVGGAGEIYERYAHEIDGDALEKMMYCEVKIRLPECMLSRTDRMTMAVSLEGRTPFLDHRVVECAMRLDSSMKVGRGEEKYILRRALGRVVPPSILERKKQGLAVPFAQWTKYGIEAQIRRVLSAESVGRRGLFEVSYVQDLLDRWGSHAARHSQLIWSLFCLELWFRLYMDSPALDPHTPLSAVA